MLPIERLNRIKEILDERQNIKISELSNLLNVSEMTIHRDLKPLVEDGVVLKTFGGVSLKQRKQQNSNMNICVYCSRDIHQKLAYRIILSNGQIEVACCAHCGLLRHHQLRDDVVQSICYDFLRQTTISAPLASFVFDTTVDLGCCQPQVLTFEWEEDAHKFIKGFDGIVCNFNEAITLIYEKMNCSELNYHQHSNK